ncbi:MAG: translocation/assembly module TamB domain-containing protein, partial [Hyphomicrobiales bacterium]|nr:translocation/assembly module TamB domain-containing protein [Hyphomicrobiales bacterium]
EALAAAEIKGMLAEPEWAFTLSLPDATLRGKKLADGKIALTGRGRGLPRAAELAISGTLGGEALSGGARLARRDDGGGAIDDLDFTFAEARISGNLVLSPDGRLSGPLDIAIPDLAPLSPLALTEMSGRIAARLDFAAENGRQDLQANANIEKVAVGEAQIGKAEIVGTVRDLFGTLSADGRAIARAVNVGTVRIDEAAVDAVHRGEVTTVDLRASSPDGTISGKADIAPAGDGIEVAIAKFDADYHGIVARLQAPTQVRHAGGVTAVAPTTLALGGGRFTISGEAGDRLNLDIGFSDIPAKLANRFSPKLGADGSVSGTAKVAGTPDAPVVDWTLALRQASLAETRGAGLPAVSIDGAGRYAGNRLSLDARIGGVEGLDLKVAGRAPVATGDSMDLKAAGRVPLSIAQSMLRARGTRLSGTLTVDLALTGRPPVPAIAGRLGVEGGRVSDPQTGLSLASIAADGVFSNGALTIRSLTGNTADGGKIAASGRVEINPDNGFPGDMKITARSLRYTDGKLVNALFDADLTLGGRLAAAPNVGGTITLNRTEITVPEELPVSVSALDIDHRNAPDAVKRQNESLRGGGDGGAARKGPAVRLDLTVRAPGRFFVRGRGLDTEMEGTIRITGTPESPRVNGAFAMRRGRLSILGKRLEFSRGEVDFAGDLDPYLDFLATTETSDATVSIAVTGQASDPEFTFTSSPALPQDEVLARLLFDRGIDKLSPTQIATLAAEVAKLGGVGGKGPGILEKLRQGIGVDDLDVGTDEAGNATVKAGRYVTDRVYLGVKQGTTADSSKVTVDIDVTKNLKAKGEVGADGSSKLGVGVEWDY